VPNAEQVAAICRLAAERDAGRYHVGITLAAATGLRLGEVAALRWPAVDLDHATLRVVAQVQPVRGELRVLDPKTDRSRRQVPIPPATIALLRRHRAAQLERRLLLGEAWQDLDLVLDRGDGTLLDPSALSHALSRYATAAGADGVRFHDLRHAYATRLLEAGVHPKIVSDLLGHASTAFTMDTYQHVTPSLAASAADVIQAALGDALGSV
jgi:integrase